MNGHELTTRLISDIEKSVAGRYSIINNSKIKDCTGSLLNPDTAFETFLIVCTYDWQLRFDAMRLTFFLDTNKTVKDELPYKAGNRINLPRLLRILKHEKYDVARRFDVIKTSADIDRSLACRFYGLMHLLHRIHDMADIISQSAVLPG